MFKYIAIRLLAGVVLLVINNVIYVCFFYEKDLQHYSPMVNELRNLPDNTDILYLGESSNITYAETDKDKRHISEFLSDHFPTLSSRDITKEASHAGIYYTLLNAIPEEKDIQTVVVTMNLRSFNAQWIHSEQETALRKSMVLLEDYPPFWNRIRLSFKGYDYKGKELRREDMKTVWRNDVLRFPYKFPHRNIIEWDEAMAATGIKDDQGKIDAKTDLACHYIKAYGFQIDTLTNPRIEDFDKIVQLAKEKGWNLVFNFLAENVEKGKELVGKDLFFLMNRNRNILTDYYQRKGVRVVDNLEAVENAYFIDQNWTTEHYSEEGRKTIAENLAKGIKQFHHHDDIKE